MVTSFTILMILKNWIHQFFFRRYCAKSPQLKACIHAVTAGVTPCLPAEFRDHVVVADNATEKLIDFACHKDGDRIACKWLDTISEFASIQEC